ncbi:MULTISPECIES: hypothetical protein [Streptococcus]|uniref:hypothetical protein n=1 Tax=Streptococcus TaxID=1301 RepID=UPI0008A8783E|nr:MULTISPECIES: hypothetical protein [Streptococcus]OHR62329.1 hypothetical protein HMPREF2634_08550 [Streptococcus sp. HMSC034B03]
MNKRIKKKVKKRSYKIPKYIIRLTKKWTELDNNMVFLAEFRNIEDQFPKKLIESMHRKYRRINSFLDELEGDEIFRYNFSIYHGAYGEEQLNGEYCDQSCGYSGDDFRGVYYYPIGNKLYFAYNYEC